MRDWKGQYGKGKPNAARFAEIATIDRSVSLVTNAHLAAIINDRQAEILRRSTLWFSRLAGACLARRLHAIHKVKPRGGPRRSWRWSLPPRSAHGDNTRRVVDRCRRVSRRLLQSIFMPAKTDRHRRSTRIEDIRMVYIAKDRICIFTLGRCYQQRLVTISIKKDRNQTLSRCCEKT